MQPVETERILREVGAANHGVATRRQLLAHGIAARSIDRMVRNGRLRALRRGLYQVGPLPSERAAEAAAVLACGPDARISHSSAGAMHGIVAPGRADAQPEVTVPRRSRRSVTGARVHRVRAVRPDEVTMIDGLPVTTPGRTVLDLAETLTSREMEQALATALRMRLVTRAKLRRMLDRHPRHRGVPMLRRLLDDETGPAFTRSEAEEKLLAMTRSARLPRPDLNAQLLEYEVDFLWRTERVVAEVDGYAFHASPGAFAADRRRDAELTAAGYHVLRFTWGDVTGDTLATVARLAEALSLRLTGRATDRDRGRCCRWADHRP